jgi:hypothetical protein
MLKYSMFCLALFVTSACSGDDGASSLLRVDSEPAGANCPAGGTRIATGIDDNGDGELDDSEVSSEFYDCSAAATRVDEEEPGDNCVSGGFAIHTGTDADGDGALSDDEIEDTRYVCNGEDPRPTGIVVGDVTIRSSADVYFYENVVEITGALHVELTQPLRVTLPNLVKVGTGLGLYSDGMEWALLNYLQNSEGEDIPDGLEIDFPLLEEVTGSVNIYNAPYVSLPSLTTVETFSVGYALEATTTNLLDLGALETVDYLTIKFFDGLTTLDLGSLTDAGNIVVTDNPLLSSMDLSMLDACPGTFDFISNPMLPQCEVQAVYDQMSTQPGDYNYSGNDEVATCP